MPSNGYQNVRKARVKVPKNRGIHVQIVRENKRQKAISLSELGWMLVALMAANDGISQNAEHELCVRERARKMGLLRMPAKMLQELHQQQERLLLGARTEDDSTSDEPAAEDGDSEAPE
jgi:hypothetical protein